MAYPSRRPHRGPARKSLRKRFAIPNKLVRKRRGITGVSAGIADYFNVSPALVRLTFIFGAVLSSGLALIAYAALYLIMPKEREDRFGEDGRFGSFEEPDYRSFESGVSIRRSEGIKVNTSVTLDLCPKCDTVSKPDSDFCHKCGSTLHSTE